MALSRQSLSEPIEGFVPIERACSKRPLLCDGVKKMDTGRLIGVVIGTVLVGQGSTSSS